MKQCGWEDVSQDVVQLLNFHDIGVCLAGYSTEDTLYVCAPIHIISGINMHSLMLSAVCLYDCGLLAYHVRSQVSLPVWCTGTRSCSLREWA